MVCLLIYGSRRLELGETSSHSVTENNVDNTSTQANNWRV